MITVADKVDSLCAKHPGMSISAACDKVGITNAKYYHVKNGKKYAANLKKRKAAEAAAKSKPAKRKAAPLAAAKPKAGYQKLVTAVPVKTQAHAALIIGTPEQLREVLGGL